MPPCFPPRLTVWSMPRSRRRTRVRCLQPQAMHVNWFDDAIELASWGHVSAGYIQTSPIYDHAVAEAERRGWPVIKLGGTYLHPMLQPAETATAIVSMSVQLESVAAQV